MNYCKDFYILLFSYIIAFKTLIYILYILFYNNVCYKTLHKNRKKAIIKKKNTLYNYEDTNTRIRTMGFLLGAFGKLQAGARYRSLQAQMMRVSSRLRRASRDVANMEKMLDRQQKSISNAINYQLQSANVISQENLQSTMMKDWIGKTPTSSEEQAQYNKSYSDFSMALTQAKTTNEMQAQQMKQYYEDYFQAIKDTQLEALKDEEDSLQLEKETLETQIQIAKQDYEACKEMEKSDAQMLKPSYTGGGQ